MRKVNREDPHNAWKAGSPGRVKLNLRLSEAADGEGVPSVLIEGSKTSLEALARVIAAVAADKDCGYGVSPTGPGNVYFSKRSKLGIYIHRLPCVAKRICG